MTRRTLAYVLLSLVAAAICVRLGVWQLTRLGERRAYNATVSARLAEPPVSVGSALPTDTGALHHRRVRVTGRFDYGHELLLVNRSREGSPGVNILTPVRVAGMDTLVLVNRGWVYSPNGTEVDLARWREPDSIDASGWVEIPTRQRGVARLSSVRGAFRWLDPVVASREVGAPVTPFYVVLDPPPGDPPQDRPVRLPRPALDEGPHQSYAIQWFSFAVVALVGAVVFARAQRRNGPGADAA